MPETTKIEAAAGALVEGASGNGSRMTVSKSHYDALVDALRTAKRDWIPVCNNCGEILYWIAIDGERRTDMPPRAEWSPEMDGYEIGQ